jgi:hypothetical protein
VAAATAAAFALAPMARAAASEEPVQAEFLADASAVAAGQPFKVGVLFRIAPEWHIYWKYPGDAGLPTAVALELPRGFVAGELEWPLPQPFVQPGDLTGYGYTGSVMLMAEVTPPKDLPAGTGFAIRAKAQWLSCGNICRPGHAELSATLAAAPQPAPANEALFREWAARLPRTEKEWTAAGLLRAVVAGASPPPRANASGGRAGWRISIVLTWAGQPARVEFFPAPTEALLTDKPSVSTSGSRTEIAMTARASGVGAADRLECLVVFTLPDGQRGGFPLTVQLPGLA